VIGRYLEFEPELHPKSFVAKGARLLGRVHLAEGANIWYNAVLRADLEPIRVGRYSNLQDGVLGHIDIGYPLEIGEMVTVGHGAILHGTRIHDLALIGMGAILLSGSEVGEGSVIGAGSVLPEGKSIPPGVLAFGQPARIIRDLRPEEIEEHRRWAEEYWRMAENHRRALEG